ncbi:MAG: hypothetical protein GX801_02465 [Fibrobacter sp.]|nr:hypothetical protein [Fibrobacter sp.]
MIPKASTNILLLMIFGLVVLIAAAGHFAPPLFGWIIIVAIILVFIVSMIKYRKTAIYLDRQKLLLKDAKTSSYNNIAESSILADRVKKIKEIFAAKQNLDSRIFAELQSARSSVNLGRSAGGVVILLGLAGTFYGLMVAISNAGGSLDSGQTSQTISAIENIFSSMMGIFGTSFAGLIAALFLNISHSLLVNRQMLFMADVEEYTQFKLIPQMQADYQQSTDEKDAYWSEFKELLVAVRADLNEQNQSSVVMLQDSLEKIAEELGGTMNASWEKISGDVQKELQENLSANLQNMQEIVTQSEKILAQNSGELHSLWENWLENQANQQRDWQNDLAQNAQNAWSSVEQSVGALQESLGTNLQQILANLDNTAKEISQNAQKEIDQNIDSSTQSIEQLAQNIQQSFGELSASTNDLLSRQSSLVAQMDSRMEMEQNISTQLHEGVGETAALMRTNQSELQASLELFNQGIEGLLQQLSQKSSGENGPAHSVEQIQIVLESFTEKTTELLEENALRSQEIMLELMEQIRSSTAEQ